MKNDAQLALEAAESMTKRMKQDVAIMMDLSTKLLKDAKAALRYPLCRGEAMRLKRTPADHWFSRCVKSGLTLPARMWQEVRRKQHGPAL